MLRGPLWVVGSLLLLLSCRVDAEEPSAAQIERWFTEGERLIEVNCGVCDQRSPQALEEGVRLVEAAVEAGYADPVAAYRLLASAYGTLAWVDAEPDSEEQRRFAAARVEALAAVVAASPEDSAAMVEQALAMSEGPEQAGLLRKALEQEPSNARAMFFLGRWEVRNGAPEAGMKRMRAAFDTAEGMEKIELGRKLAIVLGDLGQAEAAASLRSELESLEEEVLAPGSEEEEEPEP